MFDFAALLEGGLRCRVGPYLAITRLEADLPPRSIAKGIGSGDALQD